MSHIFVSYSRKDSETVDNIVSRLNEDGLDVWIDREDITGGELWREAIVKAIDNTYAFVLMLSPNSVASKNVRKEVDLADGADKDFIPVLLAPVNLPVGFRYPLAGIQWIEYYRDPEAKYAELVEVLQGHRQKLGVVQMPPTREVELVFSGLDLSKLSDEERERLAENLLNSISTTTNTPRADLDLVKMTDGSIHAFVNMPADSAYHLKTAALNRDARLIKLGISALRLSGDRYFVLLKKGRIGPLRKSGSPRWFIGGLALVITLLLAALIITVVLPLAATIIATATPTPTNTFTPTPSYTSTSTKTFTPTITPTSTSTSTWTPTPTHTPTLTPSSTNTPTITQTATPNPPTTFSPPIVSPKTFYGIYCGVNNPVTITVFVSDPSGISNIQIYFWLVDKISGATTIEPSLPMQYTSGAQLPGWQRKIYPYPDIPNQAQRTEYWFQFYFVATDNAGAQTQSQTYSDLATLSTCPEPPK